MKSKLPVSKTILSFSGAIWFATLLGSAGSVNALTLYDSRTHFLNDTGSAEISLEVIENNVASFTLDKLKFTIARPPRETFNLRGIDWTNRIPGVDLAVNGVESFDVEIDYPIDSFGFDFVEPEFDPLVGATFIDSTFEITLLNSESVIDSFEFQRPNDIASFVGFSSNSPFDKVEIREIVGGAENEFFGSFYTGSSKSVPEPSLILGSGILGLGFFLIRKSPIK